VRRHFDACNCRGRPSSSFKPFYRYFYELFVAWNTRAACRLTCLQVSSILPPRRFVPDPVYMMTWLLMPPPPPPPPSPVSSMLWPHNFFQSLMRFMFLGNLIGFPAIVLPTTLAGNNLPLAVQVPIFAALISNPYVINYYLFIFLFSLCLHLGKRPSC
jgi:hypothetical protein